MHIEQAQRRSRVNEREVPDGLTRCTNKLHTQKRTRTVGRRCDGGTARLDGADAVRGHARELAELAEHCPARGEAGSRPARSVK